MLRRPLLAFLSAAGVFLIFFPTAHTSLADDPSLSYGSSGNAVVLLQNQLIKVGYLAVGENTGYFGPLTEAAVKAFQCAQNIICSNASVAGYGTAGPHTHMALNAAVGAPSADDETVPSVALSYGDSGNDIVLLQQALIDQGDLASGEDTGYFGPLTRAAVKQFQCAQNIVCSGSGANGWGVYGPKTHAALASVMEVPVQPSLVAGQSLTGPATGAFEISGWIPDWRAASGTADVLSHLSYLTSVMPFGFVVSNDGVVTDSIHIEQAPWPSFIAQAKAAGVRVVPTIEWGNGAAEQAILSDTSKRIALEDQIATLAKADNFDGVDIDFEAKEAATINYFSTFLEGLSERLGNKWLYCTAEARMPLDDRYESGEPIPPDATDYANDYAAMGEYCDRVEIMAYDQGTIDLPLDAERPAPYAPVADPEWVTDLVKLAAKSIPKNKLIIGIPDYGYEYKVTPLASGGYQYDVLWAFNPLYATQLAAELHIAPYRTSAGELGFVYTPNMLTSTKPTDGNKTETQQQISTTTIVQNQNTQVNLNQPFNFVTWSDAQAIASKVALAHTLGVRGVAIFSLGGAEDPAMWSLMK